MASPFYAQALLRYCAVYLGVEGLLSGMSVVRCVSLAPLRQCLLLGEANVKSRFFIPVMVFRVIKHGQFAFKAKT